MKTTLKIILGIAFIVTLSESYAQQEAQFTQFLDNMAYYNPAYAGSQRVMSFSAMHRQQWVNFDGAPMSTTFSVHTPIGWENLGVGLSVLNDRVGPNNATWINADVSYSLKFRRHKGRLSFGIKGGINLINGDIASLTTEMPGDASLDIRYQNVVQPNLGAGVYYHSKRWFIGAAVPRIIDNIKDAGNIINPKYVSQRHYYLMGGGYMNVGRLFKIRPSGMVKFTPNAPLAIDADLAFIIQDKFFVGANYRVLESAALYFQILFKKQFKIGYSFEFSTSKLRSHNAGTHELMLSYDLNLRGKRMSSPRFF